MVQKMRNLVFVLLLVAVFSSFVSETQGQGVEPIPPLISGGNVELIPPAILPGGKVTVFDPDYPVGTPRSQGGTGDHEGWHNAQGMVYNANEGGYHSGEDWNADVGSSSGKPVHAIEDGRVVGIRKVLWSGHDYGSGIVVEHTLPNGEKIYSLYEHIVISTNPKTGDSLKIGDSVQRGQQIGTIYAMTELPPHLHFELRTKPNSGDPDKGWDDNMGWNPHALSNGYYFSQKDLEADGLIDPSIYIDFSRVVAKALTNLSPHFGEPLLPSPISYTPSNGGSGVSDIGKPLIGDNSPKTNAPTTAQFPHVHR